MAIDAAQILRQTYASQADAARMMELASGKEAPVQAPQQSGQIMGAQVVVEADPMAELMDSMEELSFQFEETGMKKIGERKMGEAQGSRSAYVKAVEKWMALFPDMPDNEFASRILRMLRHAKASGRPMGSLDLLRELGRGSTDPSHQFAMLDILEQALGGDEGDLRTLISQARRQLENAKGPEIRAGINLAQEINARATTPGEMQNLREMYRSEVVGFTTPQDCFRSLVSARGPGGLSDAIAFLIAGCGKDLKSAMPSLGEEALSRILTDLQCVQVLNTVMDKLTLLAGRMAKQFGEMCQMNGEQMTGRVLDFTEQQFVPSSAIAAFIGECGVRKLLAQLDFATELTKLFRQLSPRLFRKESDRKQLIDSTQEHLDELIMREEQEGDDEEEGES